MPLSGSGRYAIFDWEARRLGTLTLPRVSGGPPTIAQPAPDGTLIVANAAVDGVVRRAVVDLRGQALSTIDPEAQYQWGDDSRHLCLVAHSNPGPDQESMLELAGARGGVRRLGSLGAGDTAQDTLHLVAVCSPLRDLVVILDQRLVASASGEVSATTIAVREFSLSHFTLLLAREIPGAPPRASVAPDGRLMVVPSNDGTSNQVIDLSTGTVEASITHRFVIGFTADGTQLLTATRESATSDVVALIEVARGRVTASLAGELTWLQTRPGSADVAVGVSAVTGPDATPPGPRYVILRGDGAEVPLLGV